MWNAIIFKKNLARLSIATPARLFMNSGAGLLMGSKVGRIYNLTFHPAGNEMLCHRRWSRSAQGRWSGARAVIRSTIVTDRIRQNCTVQEELYSRNKLAKPRRSDDSLDPLHSTSVLLCCTRVLYCTLQSF